MATPFDPPWRLDPLKNIVGVGWGGALIVIGFTYTASASGTSVSWKAFFTGDTDDSFLRGKNINEEIGPAVSPPGPPSTTPPSIPANNNAWHYPRRETSNTETNTGTFEVIDLAHFVGYISGGFPFFGGDFATAEEAYNAFKVGFNQLFGRDPDPLDPHDMFVGMAYIITSHTETRSTSTTTKEGKTITFVNIARIVGLEPAVKSSKKLRLVVRMEGGTTSQFIRWGITIAVFIGGVARKFVLDDSSPVLVRPDPDRAPLTLRNEASVPADEAPKPAVEVTFTIDLANAYAITATRRNL